MSEAQCALGLAVFSMLMCRPEPCQAQLIPIPKSPARQAGEAERGEFATYRVSRVELGRSYVRVEREVAARPLMDVAMRRAVNLGVDRATGAFFSGDFSRATAQINRQLSSLDAPAFGGQMADALGRRATVTPPVLVMDRDKDASVRVALSRLYPAALSEGGSLDIQLLDRDGRALCPVPGACRLKSAGEGDEVVELNIPGNVRGRVTVMLGTGGRWVDAGSVQCLGESLEATRTRALDALNALDVAPALRRAAAIARWRAEQLTEDQARAVAGLVMDFDELQESVEREVEQIARGSDPYQGRTGDMWMSADVSGVPLPMRLFVPEPGEGEDSSAMRPLVIAVHGAGGDEHLFPTGHAGGLITRLAQDKRFLLACPRAGVLTGTPATFDAIVEAVCSMHNVDRRRVYVMGHSLGGGAVCAWAKGRPDRIAGVVSIAGIGLFGGAKSLPPTLTIAGELDGLCSPERIEADARRAERDALPIEYRLIPDTGHALVVGACLPEAVDWLLQQVPSGENRLDSPP